MIDAFLIEATAEYAASKGLDPDRARAHMAQVLTQMSQPRDVFLKKEQAQLLIWSRVCR